MIKGIFNNYELKIHVNPVEEIFETLGANKDYVWKYLLFIYTYIII